jgi:hypothetical protein
MLHLSVNREILDEYKGNKYNLIYSSVPININYIRWLRGTDEHNYLYSSVSRNRRTYW